MRLLAEILPDFARKVEDSLRSDVDYSELAGQIPLVGLVRWDYHADEDAGFIYLEPSRELNILEQNVTGPRYSHSAELKDLPGMVVVDVDNFGRITGIELINRADIFDELARKLPELRSHAP